MTRIIVKQTSVGGVQKKIADLRKFMKNDLAKEAMLKAEDKIQAKWRMDIPNIFSVRSSQGYRCDGILAKSLGIVMKGKDSIVIYVEPIVRFSKNSTSSGGAVNNLTSILFRGSRASYGAYYPRWDARAQTGMHPGTSPSKMRNYWMGFKKYAREEVRKAINAAMKKQLKKKAKGGKI
jgi:hypothetical protein